MMKRAFVLILLVLSLLGIPTVAQEQSLLDWIPVGYEGFLRVDMSNPAQTLNALNFSVVMATVLQPTRIAIDSNLSYDDFFPLTALDVENVTFNATILPWLRDEIIIAYRTLPSDYRAALEDVLLILPTEDPFNAASGLTSIIQGQDLLEQSTYRDVTVYRGDQLSFAFTPLAVLMGSEEAIHEVLDTAAGEADALTADGTYQQVRTALPKAPPALVYFHSSAAANGLGYALSGGGEAAPLLGAIGETLTELLDSTTVETALLTGAIDGLGIGLQPGNTFSSIASATAVFHTTDTNLQDSSGVFDPSVLEFVPRNALLLQSGSNAQNAAYTSLAALPLSNFSGLILGGFPVRRPVPSELPVPTASDMEAVVHGFADAVQAVNQIDLFEDVINNLQGSYAFALLPRPNDPLPVVNTPFDAMLVAQVEDSEAVFDNLSSLLTAFVGEDNVDTEMVDDQSFTTLRVAGTGETLLRMGLVDDLLLIGTGEAAQTALNARRGDNRLISQPRWEAVSSTASPNFYVDIPAFYTTFFPSAASQAAAFVRQVSIYSQSLGEGLYEVKLQVTLPTNQ